MLVILKCLTVLMVMTMSGFVSAENSSNAVAATLPVINARFETDQCAIPCKKSAQRDWWMMRTAHQVELRDLNKKTGQLSSFGEIWRHSDNGRMGYLYLMHADKRAIEYLFDDLKILAIKADEPQWQMLTQLITNDDLATLKKSSMKSVAYHGHLTERYSGKIGSGKELATIDLVWIPTLNIPAKIVYAFPKRKVTVQLREFYAEESSIKENSKAPATSDEVLASYQQVYFTDIGDMEQSDDAKEWIEKAHGAPGLHAHHH